MISISESSQAQKQERLVIALIEVSFAVSLRSLLVINTMWLGKPNSTFKYFNNKVVVIIELQSLGYGHQMVNFRLLDEAKNYRMHSKDFYDTFDRYAPSRLH